MMKPDTCVCGYTSARANNMARHVKICGKAKCHEEATRQNFIGAMRELMLDRIGRGETIDAAALRACMMPTSCSCTVSDTDCEGLTALSADASTDCEGLTDAGIDASTDCEGLTDAGIDASTDCEGLATFSSACGSYGVDVLENLHTRTSEASRRGRALDLGDQDCKDFEWQDYPIITHVVRDDVVEYYDTWPTKCVLASAPLGGWGGASFAVRTAVRMHHAMSSGLAEDVVESGPRSPCPHDTVTCTNTPLRTGLGDAELVESLEVDEGGVFTYMVTFEHGTQAVRCGHDLQGYPQSLRREIRYFWRESVQCPTAPHFLGSMARVFDARGVRTASLC